MNEIALVGYSQDDNQFTLMEYGKGVRFFPSVVDLVAAVSKSGNKIIMNNGTLWEMQLMFCQVATDAGLVVHDARGVVLNELAQGVLPTLKYLTRKELGNILPDGWFIEHQLNRYSACHGEDVSLPHRTTLARAILDIHAFLASVAAQATTELVTSIAAQLEQQNAMFD